jgi:3-oxoacyl-[acyl-carrier protein] reductase
MEIGFAGQTVVVSGARHGFGRCIAQNFARLGAAVFGCDLSAAELAETAGAPGGIATEIVDLSDRDGGRMDRGSKSRRRLMRSMC